MMNEKVMKRLNIGKPKFCVSLIGYWFLLPLLFVAYLLLKITIEHSGFQQLLMEDTLLTVMLLIALLTPFSAYFLFSLPKESRSKANQAGMFLKLIIAQQLLVGNLVGAILVFLTYRELPASNDTPQNKQKMSSVYTLVSIQYIISFVAVYALMILIKNGG